MRRSDIVALVAAGAVLLAPGRAVAHFVLQSPASWAEQDAQGNPQKTAPCGQADPQIAAVPTNARAAYERGPDDHRRHRRGHVPSRALPRRAVDDGAGGPAARSGDDGAGHVHGPRNPGPARLPGARRRRACPTRIRSTDRRRSRSRCRSDVTCTNCTLQVLEFMQADVGASGNCFYHHCATLSIAAAAATDGGADGDGGGGTVVAARSASGAARSVRCSRSRSSSRWDCAGAARCSRRR